MPENAARRLCFLIDVLGRAPADAVPSLLARIRDVGIEWARRERLAGTPVSELWPALHELANVSRRLEPERRGELAERGRVRHVVGEPREPCDWRYIEPLLEAGQ